MCLVYVALCMCNVDIMRGFPLSLFPHTNTHLYLNALKIWVILGRGWREGGWWRSQDRLCAPPAWQMCCYVAHEVDNDVMHKRNWSCRMHSHYLLCLSQGKLRPSWKRKRRRKKLGDSPLIFFVWFLKIWLVGWLCFLNFFMFLVRWSAESHNFVPSVSHGHATPTQHTYTQIFMIAMSLQQSLILVQLMSLQRCMSDEFWWPKSSDSQPLASHQAQWTQTQTS